MTRNLKIVIICLFTMVLITIYLLKNDNKYVQMDTSGECCTDQNKNCWACQKKMTIAEFCALNPGQFSCPDLPKCCTERRKTCIACTEDISVDEACKMYPDIEDCLQLPKCCKEQTKECLSCQKNQTMEVFCLKNPGLFGCIEAKKCCVESTKECLACQNKLSVEEFCVKNLGKYGCEDIMIGILLSNKPGYIQFTSSILKQYHNIPEYQIHIFDDASADFDEAKIREWYGSKVNFNSPSKPLGVGRNIRKLFEYFSASKYNTLFMINEETLFLKEWKSYINAYIHNATDGFLSLYHSSIMHNYTIDCQNMIGDLCNGPAFGSYGVALTKSFVVSIMKEYSGPFDMLNWVTILEKHNLRSLYPRKSLTMQIGQTNQSSDNCGVNEVAYKFNRCEYPDWIQNGIEFYFDRCTSSKELFSSKNSMNEIEKAARFWTRPVISYCLYGERRRYTQIAQENAVRAFSIYPGWKLWVYTDGTVPANVMQNLCESDVRFIDMSKTNIKSKMSWRFLVASDPVKMYAVRDIDSYLLERGSAAVDEWIKSGRKFHNMRDHPNHSRYPMSGGMWGGLHEAIPQMRQLLETRQMNNNYMQDMNFLNDVVWKIASKSVWTHDSHSLHKFGEDHPFPTKQKGPQLFVGNVVIWPG